MAHIHGGNIEKAKIEYNLTDEEIIDFSANINLLGAPDCVLQVIKENLGKIERYPQPDSIQLKKELARRFNKSDGELVVGNGAAELIYLLVKIIKPDSALVLAPSFSEYELAAKSMEAEIRYLYLKDDDFSLDRERLFKYFNEVDMAFLCNPHNPTGVLQGRENIVEIIQQAQAKDVFLVVDEAFMDFVDRPEAFTVIDLAGEYDNLFILRSLTKFYAIPGLRLGFAAGSENIISSIEQRRDPWSVNILAQIAGKAALRDKKYIVRTQEINKREREFLYRELKKIRDIKVYKPSVNFIFIQLLKPEYSSRRFCSDMGKRGLLIRDCSSYRGLNDSFIRVAVKSREENEKLLASFKTVYAES